MTVRHCQSCFAKFLSSNFDIDDTPPSERPIEVDKDLIKALIHANRQITREVVDRLNLQNFDMAILMLKMYRVL